MQNRMLTSKTNPQIKELRLLIEKKKYREKLGAFVLEGAKIIDDTLDTDFVIDKIFITEKAIEKYAALYSTIKTRNLRVTFITGEVADWVADSKTSQGIFAVVKSKKTEDIVIKPDGKYILLEEIQDPGNVGTILRTALAFGVDGVFISDNSAELYSPKVIRGSAGAVLKMNVQMVATLVESIKSLKENGIATYSAALDKRSLSLKDVDLSKNVAVVMGNEGAGISKETMDICEKKIIIPMSSGAESLNVGIASALIIWEMNKNRI